MKFLARRRTRTNAEESSIRRSNDRLAERAEVRTALPNHDFLDRRAAARAGLALLIVHVEVLLVTAGLAIAVAIVAQCAAAVLDSLQQRQADTRVQPCDLVVVQAVALAQRVQLGVPKRFVGVDVADSGDRALVEQQWFQACMPAAQQR